MNFNGLMVGSEMLQELKNPSLDRNAIQVERGTINPVEADKFDTMTTQGSFEQGVDNSAQVEQQINLNNTNEQSKIQSTKTVSIEW